MEITKRKIELIDKAVRRIISELRYEWHQARMHGCTNGTFETEIKEFEQLREELRNESRKY